MKTNKELEKLVEEIHKMSGIGKITLTERIQALLTSEVEKERERLLNEVEQFFLDNEFTPSYEDWEKQRKALSDIGGKDEK